MGMFRCLSVLMTAAVKPTTTVTYTGAELTSYLLNGASPSIFDVSDGASTTATTPRKTAQLVAGTDFSKPFTAAIATDTSSSFVSESQQASSIAAAAGTTETASPENANSNTNNAGSSIKLNTPAIVGIVVGSVGLLAIIALILFLLARHKRTKDRQHLNPPPSPTNEKGTPASPSSNPTTPTRTNPNPFHDSSAEKAAVLKRTISNPRRKQTDVTASFDFGGLVPTKNNYGKDGRPIIAPTGWDDRDVGRPFSLSRVRSPESDVAVVGDETPIDYVGRTKTPSPNKQDLNGGGSGTSPETSPSDGKKIRRKAPPTQQDRGLPISRPLSPFDDRNSIGSDTALRVIPIPPAGGMKFAESSTSIASTGSGISTKKHRPMPISIPPIHTSDSRDSIIIDKSASPPMTSPPCIPTPPLPSLEFRKEWERLKRNSTASVDSTDTNILDEVSPTVDDSSSIAAAVAATATAAGNGAGTVIPAKVPLAPQTHSINVQPLTRNPSVKQVPRTVVIPPAATTPANPGEILKKEKTLLRVPSTASSLSSTSTSSISSNTSPKAQSGPNKRSPSIVAATVKWAEKRKALNAALAHQHNARANKENAPLPTNAAEKVEDARKSTLAPSAQFEENRMTPPLSPRKREVEGRSCVTGKTDSIGSPTLSVFKCYDPERESTFVPGEALNMMRAMEMEEDKENSAPASIQV